MTTLERKVIAQNLRRRSYRQDAVDPIQDAAIISEKVRGNSGCAFALGTGLLLVIVLAGLAVAL